ncbi:VOC family protein [Chondromyces apiculatus]|uniref:Glyoxalase/bleomycin resistance protein/dioxygenase n=1 Tax=Chondromyces apiculatus DSM 436 TaxID=1192034 RepID=A0A017T1H5_9BACT|nr:VOC family protein [Chondromyces apiculatus]EYF02857.1 Glyoxalase/bleomycin resistance protein/dioxygenase [Chondromyces apiculatus DSM 436]
MMEPLAVHHLAVVVHDLERAEAFYGGLLGLPVVRRWTDEAGAPRSVWLGLGGGAFLAVERAGAEGPTRVDAAPGFHCVALAIGKDARERWRERLAAAGAHVERESAYTLYVRDPEGNLVGLSHYPA